MEEVGWLGGGGGPGAGELGRGLGAGGLGLGLEPLLPLPLRLLLVGGLVDVPDERAVEGEEAGLRDAVLPADAPLLALLVLLRV